VVGHHYAPLYNNNNNTGKNVTEINRSIFNVYQFVGLKRVISFPKIGLNAVHHFTFPNCNAVYCYKT